MKMRAPGIQRTGQPRWAQLTENAMNSRSPVRRSHAALLAVIPAHGSGEASTRLTFVVSPSLKSPTLPTVRQTMGPFWSRGARVNPTSGTASPPHPVPSPTQTRARKRRRSGDSGAALAASPGESLFRVMNDLSDPVKQGVEEQHAADERHHERADEAPREERHRKGEERRPRGGSRRTLGWAGAPPGRDGASGFAHDAPSALTCGAP